MSALQFPQTRIDGSPLQPGDQYIGDNNVIYSWDGAKWLAQTTFNTGTSLLAVDGDILPKYDLTYNLGSDSHQWKSLYVGTSTIYIDHKALSITSGNDLTINGAPVGIRGNPGIQGVQGVIGPKGDRGDPGPQGLQGIQGSTGTQGVQGPLGFPGDQGPIGNTGTQGPRGFTGAQGISLVLIGSTGTVSTSTVGYGQAGQGWIGTSTGHVYFWNTLTVRWEDIGPIVGPQGDVGIQGPKGDQGLPGSRGSEGIQGVAGPAGPQGIQGLTGPQGPIGNTGTQGIQGIQGPQGEQGLRGFTGATGPRGDAGASANTANFIFSNNQVTVANDGNIAFTTNGYTWTLGGADGNLTLPNSAAISSTTIGFALQFPTNGDGQYSVNAGSLTVGIPNPDFAAAILANPGNYTANLDDRNGYYPITGISGPAPGTNVYTITGDWYAGAYAFPVFISSNDHADGVTTLSSISGAQIATAGGAWTFGLDGKLTFPNNSIFDGQTLKDHATGVNYTLKIANGGVAGSKFAIGTGNAAFGIANDALNHSENGYVPYTLTAEQIALTVPGSGSWVFGSGGNLTVPGDILAQESNDLNLTVFNPTIEGTPSSIAISLQNRDIESGHKTTQLDVTPDNILLTTDFSSAHNSWIFGKDSSLTVPSNVFPITFTVTLTSEHFHSHVGHTALTLAADPWQYTITFDINDDGIIPAWHSNQRRGVNPGYQNGDIFSFGPEITGIPGYTFTMNLSGISYTGTEWTTTAFSSIAPPFVPTIVSETDLKFTNNGGSLILKNNGSLILPGNLRFPTGYTIDSSAGNDGIRLTTDRGTILFGNHPESVPTAMSHFHIMKDDPTNVDLFLGDDSNYVKLPGDGGVVVAAENTTTIAVSQPGGPVGGSINFTRNNDYLVLATPIDLGTKNFTIEFWFKSTDHSGFNTILSHPNGSGTSFIFFEGGTLKLDNSGQNSNWGNLGSYFDDQWHYFAISCNETDIGLWIDGVSIGHVGRLADYGTGLTQIGKLWYQDILSSMRLTNLKVTVDGYLYNPTSPTISVPTGQLGVNEGIQLLLLANDENTIDVDSSGQNTVTITSGVTWSADTPLITDTTSVAWNFGTDGKLTLPNGSTIGDSTWWSGVPITTARGTIYLGNSPVIGQPSHFHIMKGGQQDIDLFLGDDSNFVKLPSTGGVEISSQGENQYTWTFGTDGTTQFPNNTLDAGTSTITIKSTIISELEYINDNFQNVANEVFDAFVGVDNNGPYLVNLAVNSNGTDINLSTWSVDSNGNLVTSIIHEISTSTDVGDIVDIDGNSIIYTVASETPPTRAPNGRLWYNSVEGRMYIRYTDLWVDASPTVIPPPSTYLGGLTIEDTTIGLVDSSATNISIHGSLIPTENDTYDLGSAENRWRSLHVGTSTIYIGGVPLSLNTDNSLSVNGSPVVTISTSGSLTAGSQTINVNASTSTLVNGSHSVAVGNDNLVLTNVQYIYPSTVGKDIDIYTASENSSELWLHDNGPAQIITNGGAHVWSFAKDGSLTFPNSSIQTTAWTGTVSINNISNINITTPVNGQVLTYNNGLWINASGGGGGGGIALTDISVTTASVGLSSLRYNNISGVFTFTPPDLSSYATQSYVTGLGYTTTASVNSLIVNSLTNYASQSYVTGLGYTTTASVNSLIVNSLTNVVKTITAGTGTAISVSGNNVTIWTTTTFNTGTLVTNAINATTSSYVPASGITGNTLPNTLYYSSLQSVGNLTNLQINGNLNFSGDNIRIQGDFTNAAVSKRLAFVTNLGNTSTGIYALPSGTSQAASWQAANNSDPTNASKILIATNGTTDVQLVSGVNGTGTYLPLSFYNGGVQQMKLGTTGILSLNSTASSTSTTTGALVVTGGVGVGGTVTANKFVGDGSSLTNITLSQAGNIIGTQSNVTLVAGSYSYLFDNTGTFTMPANGDIVMPGGGSILSVGGTTLLGGASQVNGYYSSLGIKYAGSGTQYGLTLQPAADNTNAITFLNAAGTNIGSITQTTSTVVFNMNNRPAFRVYGAGTTNNLGTTVNTNGVLNGNNWAVDYNQGSYLSTSTGVFTAPIAGLYSVHLNARVTSNTTSSAQVCVIKNYATTNVVQAMWETGTNPSVNHFGVSTIAKLAVGDTLVTKVLLGQINFDGNDSWAVAYIG